MNNYIPSLFFKMSKILYSNNLILFAQWTADECVKTSE